ncbi:unnamed protein product [Ascophyllum nodosum]
MNEPYFPPEDVEENQHEPFVLRIGKFLVAGTVAGFVECMASYPLDTIKTRIQAQPGAGSPMRYFLSAVKEDGVRSLYRGVSSRIAASMIAASVMFGANGTLKELFHADSRKPLTVPFMAAAVGTGVLEAYVYCPLEVIKTRMQVARCSPGKVTVWSMGVQLYREHGPFKGLYRGLSSMLLRDCIGNTIYFGSYELCKQALARGSPGEEAGVLAIALAGGVAGATYSPAVHPLDTVKSLIQADSLEAPEYRGVVHGFRRAVADGGGGFKGFVSLYRGLSPSVMRSSVGNAVLFLTFETMLDALGR